MLDLHQQEIPTLQRTGKLLAILSESVQMKQELNPGITNVTNWLHGPCTQ